MKNEKRREEIEKIIEQVSDVNVEEALNRRSVEVTRKYIEDLKAQKENPAERGSK